MAAVDEMMVAFKGRHKLKVYMQAKPGVSGYDYNSEIVGEHGRKGAPVGEKAVKGIGENWYVVARFSQSLDRGKYKVNFDNYFASLIY